MSVPPVAAGHDRDADVPRATAPRLRVALVGGGYVARFHLEALATRRDVEVAAICDPDLARAQLLASRWGVPRALPDCERLRELRVRVAHVLAPPDRHGAVTGELLARGIGALVEKPLALTSTEARQLGRLARDRGLPFGVNHNNVHHPTFRRLRDRVASGAIGRLEHVQLCLMTPVAQLDAGDHGHWMFQHPGNIIFEQAVHPFSQLHALLGRIRSARTTLLGSRELATGAPFHDRWSVAVEADRGTAEISLAFGSGMSRSTITAIGSDGAVEADLLHGTLSWEEKTGWLDFWNSFLAAWRRGGQLRRDAARGLFAYSRQVLGVGARGDAYFAGMKASIDAFYDALAAGALPAGAESGAEVLEWCEAVAAAAGGPRAVAPTSPAPREPRPARPGEVVVLGGSGFIGRRLTARLLAAGRPVTVAARRGNVPAELRSHVDRGALRVMAARLEEPASVAAALAGAKVVVHLATGSGETWEEVERAMVRGTLAVAEAALAEGVERFVYVSSIAALYAGPDAAIDEVRDTWPIDPQPEARDLYSRGKIETERALARMFRDRGLPVVVVRPGVVLGAGTPLQHPGLGYWVRDNHCIGWGMGRHPLPVVTADDVATALALLVAHPSRELDGRALNLCSRAPLSAAELVAELANATGRNLRFHPRPLWLSQTLEIGKWMVKRAGGRKVAFPAFRDLKSRALVPPFACETARQILGWQPVDGRDAFLDQAVRIHGQPSR